MSKFIRIAFLFSAILICATGFAGTITASSGPPVTEKQYVYEPTSYDVDITVVNVFDLSQAYVVFQVKSTGTDPLETFGESPGHKVQPARAASYLDLHRNMRHYQELIVLFDPNYWREQIRTKLPPNDAIGRVLKC